MVNTAPEFLSEPPPALTSVTVGETLALQIDVADADDDTISIQIVDATGILSGCNDCWSMGTEIDEPGRKAIDLTIYSLEEYAG